MSSAANMPVQPEASSLSHDEWWTLFDQLRLSQQPDYAEYGRPVAFFRKERDAGSDLVVAALAKTYAGLWTMP